MNIEGFRTVARDAVSMACGVFIAVNEELSGNVHPELLLLAAALLGGPSLVSLLTLARAVGRSDTPPTAGQSQASEPRAPVP